MAHYVITQLSVRWIKMFVTMADANVKLASVIIMVSVKV